MKKIVAALLVMTAAPALAQTSVFEFQGENTDQVIDAASRKACKVGSRSEINCYGYESLAGVNQVFIGKGYYQGRLYNVGGIFKQDHFNTILRAFTAKYGDPKIETKPWQSKGGASFNNQVALWDFKDGQLELESMGGKIGDSRFNFMSLKNAPPVEKPKVDF